jgi:dephospho-CoA kinase
MDLDPLDVPVAHAAMMSAVLVVGLTGGIGAGKSTVAALLAARGAHVIDVDALGRAVIAPGGRATEAVVAEFGPKVRGADGGVDRAALAGLVFRDPDALARHLAIVHPAIDEEIRASLATLPDDAVAVLDMAVLAESRLGRGQYTTVVVVEAPADVRVERAVARGMAADDVRARMANQASDADRRAIADVVLTNDGDRSALADQVERWWREAVDGRRLD